MELILIDTERFTDDRLQVMVVRHTQKNVIEVIGTDSETSAVVDRLYACGRKIRSKADRQVLSDLSKRYDLESAVYYQKLNQAVLELTANFVLDRLRYGSLTSGSKRLFFVNNVSDVLNCDSVEIPSFQYECCPEWVKPYETNVPDSNSEIKEQGLGTASIDVDDIHLRCEETVDSAPATPNNSCSPIKPSIAMILYKQLSPLIGGRALVPSENSTIDNNLVTPPRRRRLSAPTAASKLQQSILLVPLSHSPSVSTPERSRSADIFRATPENNNYIVNNNDNSGKDSGSIDVPKRLSWSLRLAPLKAMC